MSKIQWDDSYSIGVEEIDSQHRSWINIINDLHDVLYNESGEMVIDKTAKAVKSMWEYIRFHFKTEEAFMQSINYPELTSHQVIHDTFALEVLELYNDIREGKQVLSTTVMKMLTSWVLDHILQEDKKIGLYISR